MADENDSPEPAYTPTDEVTDDRGQWIPPILRG